MAGHLIAATLGHEDERTTMHACAAPGSAAAGDLGAAGADAVVAAINALGAIPAARASARCSVGRRP
jgi:hypothetical protein